MHSFILNFVKLRAEAGLLDIPPDLDWGSASDMAIEEHRIDLLAVTSDVEFTSLKYHRRGQGSALIVLMVKNVYPAGWIGDSGQPYITCGPEGPRSKSAGVGADEVGMVARLIRCDHQPARDREKTWSP